MPIKPRKRAGRGIVEHQSPPPSRQNRSRAADETTISSKRARRVKTDCNSPLRAGGNKIISVTKSNTSPTRPGRALIDAKKAAVSKCPSLSAADVVNSATDSGPKMGTRQRARQQCARPAPNKAVVGGSHHRPSAASRTAAAGVFGVDFEHKRKRFPHFREDNGTRKGGRRETEPEDESEKPRPRPPLRKRNKRGPKGAITRTPSLSSTFLDQEAEDAPCIAASSRNVANARAIERVKRKLPAKKQPALTSRRRRKAEQTFAGSPFATSVANAGNCRRIGVEVVVKNRTVSVGVSSSSRTPEVKKGRAAVKNRDLELRRRVQNIGEQADFTRDKSMNRDVGTPASRGCKSGPDAAESKRNARPKRKASLDAHSAMVALTLQMQMPVLKQTAATESKAIRRRRETLSSVVDAVVKSVVESEAVPQKRKNASKSCGHTTSPIMVATRRGSSRKASQPGSPAKPDSSARSPKNAKLEYASPVLHDPAAIPVFSHSLHCTCQSPPACPLHYQLQCACHRLSQSGAAPATALRFMSGASAMQTPSAAAAQLISSIFPAQTTKSGCTAAATALGDHVGASIPLYSQHQQALGAWSGTAWPFPTASHVLATPTTSTEGQLSGAFPAVFQGHLFIGPAHQPPNFLHQTPPGFNPVFVSADSCNFALHSPPQQPFASRVGSGSACGGVGILSSPTSSEQSPIVASKFDDMVAKNKAIYELIRGAETSPTNMNLKIVKLSKKSKKRKTSSSSSFDDGAVFSIGDEKPKRKKQKPTRKSIDEQASETGLTSAWEPVGKPIRKWVYINNDVKPIRRECYSAIRHKSETETVIRIRDCVVVKSDDPVSQSQQCNEYGMPSKRSYIGKVADFFTSPTGTLWVSLAWYYWPEQAEVTSLDDLYLFQRVHPKELLASRHIDCVSVDSIEDMAHVLTINEYNRYISENTAESLTVPLPLCGEIAPRAWAAYPRRGLMPAEDTDEGLVFFSRRVYDFHGKRILRNPSF